MVVRRTLTHPALRHEHPGAGAPTKPSAVRTYALLFATAAAVGIAVAYVLDLSHPAWAGAAAVFVMRPDPALLTSRAIGRVCATVAGVLLAAPLTRDQLDAISASDRLRLPFKGVLVVGY
jgi:uncharacterized membrane protein YccC